MPLAPAGSCFLRENSASHRSPSRGGGMTKHSTLFYMATFFGASAICLSVFYVILHVFPNFRYMLPPVILSFRCFKPFRWSISFKNILASLLFIILCYFFIFLTKDDLIASIIVIPAICYFYLGYVKEASSGRTLPL